MSFSHFLSDTQLTKQQLTGLIALAKKIKANPQDYQQALAGKSIVMLFEKPSLRTHVSFDIGIQKLGGHALYMGQQNGQLGKRERIIDVARNLACWSDAIVARVFEQSTLEELTEHAGIPVINALSNLYHPCQALADILTLSEIFEDLSSINLAYVGDGNNIANSLMLTSALAGVNFTLVCPQGHEPDVMIFNQAFKLAQQSGAKLTLTCNTKSIGKQNAIYTDTWISMGDSTHLNDISAKFSPYQVNHKMMQDTGANVVMHCQPAHLGQEITQVLFDSEYSVVSQQAENRMWAQNAVLLTLFNQN